MSELFVVTQSRWNEGKAFGSVSLDGAHAVFEGNAIQWQAFEYGLGTLLLLGRSPFELPEDVASAWHEFLEAYYHGREPENGTSELLGIQSVQLVTRTEEDERGRTKKHEKGCLHMRDVNGEDVCVDLDAAAAVLSGCATVEDKLHYMFDTVECLGTVPEQLPEDVASVWHEFLDAYTHGCEPEDGIAELLGLTVDYIVDYIVNADGYPRGKKRML